MKKTLAIITARGGSQRIPKKNIKEFCGKPIITYSIQAAMHSGCFDEVMVSTDSREIADISEAAGAKVPFMRTEQTSDNYATTADVIREVLLTYRSLGLEFDFGCCIYPTAPFLTEKILAKAMKILITSHVDAVFPVTAYSFPPQRAVIIQNGLAQMQFPENRDIRSQDLETIYHDAGQFYAFRVRNFLRSGRLLGEKTIPIIRSSLEVQDIDQEEDWIIAEMKYQLLCERKVL